ncbi:MAG: hypothetical protein II988_06650 [Clostridia bacterium]|nr:hypothetical protein [Clostridia bacterium]
MITKINVWKVIPKHIILDKVKYYRREITNQLEVPIYDTSRLDSVFDTSKITIVNNSKTPLSPFTRIIIDLTDTSDGEEKVETIYRVVDNDAVTNVVRGDKALYKHEIDLTEITKLTERHVVDNLTFTNYLPKNYATLERGIDYIESQPYMTSHVYHEKYWVENIVTEASTTTVKRKPGLLAFIVDCATQGLWEAIKNNFNETLDYYGNALETVVETVEHITITGFFPQYVTTKGYTSDSERILGPYVLLTEDSSSSSGFSKTISTNIKLNVVGTYAGSITDEILGGTSDCSLSLSSFTVTQPDGSIVSLSTDGQFKYTQEGVHTFTQTYEYYVKNTELDILFFEPAFRMTYTWEVRAIVDESSKPRKYNLEEVIDRVLSVYETRREGLDNQRFVLDDSLRPYLRSIEAPEFSLSQGTLFEALQQIGQYIHAIPRLRPKIIQNQKEYVLAKNVAGDEFLAIRLVDDDWSDWSVITFDFLGYGKNEEYKGSNYSLIDFEQPSEEYATDLLSNVQNATATNYDGVITVTEPFENGFLSTRTDSTNFEISDKECIIRTRLPIRSIVKVEAKYGNLSEQDITAFVVESAIYNLKKEYNIALGSEAKWLHLYYTEGQKNIYGLTLVKPTQVDIENFTVKEAIKNLLGLENSALLKDIIVRVTYIPFVNFKAKQYKTLIKQNEEKSTLFFNQQAHEVDVDAYGKNMNATLLKTGNVKLGKTQYFDKISSIPRIGQWHTSGYFAFLVNREINFNAPIKVSTAWSKYYNEMYANVAIKSNYRQYEISEKESTDRNLYLPEFCVVDINLDIEHFYDSENYAYYQEYIEKQLANVGFGTDITLSQVAAKLSNLEPGSSNGGSSGGSGGVVPFWGGIDDGNSGSNTTNAVSVVLKKISAVLCKIEGICADMLSENYGKKETYYCVCPVACFPFGNSIVAYFSFDDNYSAGTTSVYATSSYNEEQYIRYSNSFGRFDKMSLVYANTFTSGGLNATAFAKELYKGENAQADGVFANFNNCIVNKDSRECISVTAQLNFVTPNKNVHIGPALSATLPMVGDFSTKYNYVIFKNKQNNLADKAQGEFIYLNMPNVGYTSKTKHICISENSASNYYGTSSGSSSGSVGPFVWIEEDNSEKPLGDKVGEGYGIITEDGRICIYVEGTVYQNSLLPAIYLMFRRKI